MSYVKVKPLECPLCPMTCMHKQGLALHWVRKHTTAFQDAERVLNEYLSQNKREVGNVNADNSPGWQTYWGIKGE